MDAWRDSSFATPFVGVGSHRRTGEHGEKALMTLWRNLVVALVAAFALAACSSSDNGTDTSMSPPTEPPPTAAEMELEELKEQIAALREQLGIDPDDDVGDSIAELQTELKRLQDEQQARMDKEQAARDKEMAAEARRLAVGLDADSHFGASSTLTVTAMYGENAVVAFDVDTSAAPAVATSTDKNSKSIGAIGGWSGTEVTFSPTGGPTDEMRVYTNVDAGERVAFADWAAAADGVTFGSGAVSNPGAAGNAMHVMGAAFASGAGAKSHEANRDTDPNTDGLETFQTSGTFAGAPGTYSCTGTCSSAVAGSDGGILLTGTWVFTPNTGAMAHQADSEYQHFGWWLRKATTGYSVHVFAGSMGDAPITNVGTVGGTATYTGQAAGKYSIYDSGPKGGHFTAAVELKADFGSTDAATNGTISGKVENFSGDATGMDTWMVALPELNLAAAGTFAAANTNAVTDAERPVWSIDGRAGAIDEQTDAVWSGSLHAADDGGVPQVGVGTFRAEHDDIGNMQGAFGVTHSGP